MRNEEDFRFHVTGKEKIERATEIGDRRQKRSRSVTTRTE
jgi:hypothetical protein